MKRKMLIAAAAAALVANGPAVAAEHHAPRRPAAAPVTRAALPSRPVERLLPRAREVEVRRYEAPRELLPVRPAPVHRIVRREVAIPVARPVTRPIQYVVPVNARYRTRYTTRSITRYVVRPVIVPAYVARAYGGPVPAFNVAYAPPVIQYIGIPAQYAYAAPMPVAMWMASEYNSYPADGSQYAGYYGYPQNGYNGYGYPQNGYNGYGYPQNGYNGYGYPPNGYTGNPQYGYAGPGGNAEVSGLVVAQTGSTLLVVTPSFQPVMVDDSAAQQMGYVPGSIRNGEFINVIGFNTGSGFIATAIQ